MKTLVIFFALCSSAFAGSNYAFAPYGTTRVDSNRYGYTYYGGGRYLGRSNYNLGGGQNYYDNRGMYGHSRSTFSGQTFQRTRR